MNVLGDILIAVGVALRVSPCCISETGSGAPVSRSAHGGEPMSMETGSGRKYVRIFVQGGDCFEQTV